MRPSSGTSSCRWRRSTRPSCSSSTRARRERFNPEKQCADPTPTPGPDADADVRTDRDARGPPGSLAGRFAGAVEPRPAAPASTAPCARLIGRHRAPDARPRQGRRGAGAASSRTCRRPEIGINDVLIRVHKTGICGTDLHIESWDNWAAHDDRAAARHRARVRRRDRGGRLERQRLPSRRPRQRRGPRRPAGAAGTAWPASGTCARTPSGSASGGTAPSPSTSPCR